MTDDRRPVCRTEVVEILCIYMFGRWLSVEILMVGRSLLLAVVPAAAGATYGGGPASVSIISLCSIVTDSQLTTHQPQQQIFYSITVYYMILPFNNIYLYISYVYIVGTIQPKNKQINISDSSVTHGNLHWHARISKVICLLSPAMHASAIFMRAQGTT